MKSVQQEIEHAVKQRRQPVCPYCHAPLEIFETQSVSIAWRWDKKNKRYVKSENGGTSDKPECAVCGAKDWDFTNNELVGY